MHIQEWFPLRCIGWISLQSKGLSRVFCNIIVQKHQFFGVTVQLSHPYMSTGKIIALTRWIFVDQIMSLILNMLSRLVMEKAMAPHSSTLAWKIPLMEEPGGCSPWGREELDMTKWLPFHFSLSCIGEGNGNPLQCSYLENHRDGGAWWAAIYGVTRSQTRLKWLSSSSSRLVINFFTRNKCLLISGLQSPSAVIL